MRINLSVWNYIKSSTERFLAGHLSILWKGILYTGINYVVFSIFDYYFSNNENENEDEISLTVWIIIRAVAISPFIETLIFQKIIIYNLYFLKRWLKKHHSIILSAIAFTLPHIENSIDIRIIYTFMGGIILATVFVKSLEKTNKKNAIITTYIVHSFHNLVLILISYLTK